MNSALLKKRYNIHIISFILLSAFFGHASFATPKCPIITNQFQGANGVTIDTGPTGWSVDSSLLLRPHPAGFFFAINSNRFTATNLGAIGIVNSHVFSIAGYKAPQVSVKITSESVPDTTQYIQFYYKLDGGAPVLVATQKGNFGSLTFTSPVLNGSTVQLIIKIYDFSTTSTKSNYYIERFDVFQTAGPCTPGSPTITVTPSATNSGVLTCTNPSTTLSATSSTTGLAYFWTGPGISNTNTNATVNVTVPGTYTLIVTTGTPPATTLWGTNTITITTNKTPPALVTATNTGPLTCGTTSVTLNGTSSTSGATFSWTGPGITGSSAGAGVAVTVPGTYTVTATNPTNGCTATAQTTVAQTTTAPALLAINSSPSNTQLTCNVPSVSLTATSSTSGTTFIWMEPNGTTPTGATIAASDSGSYIVTATNPGTGCTAKDTIKVTKNSTAPAAPVITSSPSNVLTCSNPSAILTGSSSTAGATYNWSGPNSFTATGITATVASQGGYVLTVTDPANGCTSSVSATISQDFNPPANVTAINSGPLTCSNTVVTLTGSSSTSGMTFLWTGPGNFTSSVATPTTTVPGTYTLTVTNPATGCTATATTVVAQNNTAPGTLIINSNPIAAMLTCSNTSVSLTASSDVTGATYNWTGPNGFTASAASISVTTPGIYAVTALNTTNGCSSSTNANVSQNIAAPAGLLATSLPIDATLTCSVTSIALTATSALTGASYTWTGSNSFTGSTAAITVTSPGIYTVTATDPSNGCSSTANAIITQNNAAPVGLKTTANPANSQITCTHPNVVLTGTATTTSVNYSWTGPNSFTALGSVATITAPGVYTVKATDTTNGCTSTITATVTRNTNAPIGVTAGTSDVLTCLTPSVFVTGSATTPGATFSWTGPDGFTAATASAEVDETGTYNLTVTNPANGCTSSAVTIVQSNTTPPDGVTATNSGPLNCINTSVILTGNSTTPGALFTWVAPDNSLTQGATTTVTTAGTYTLVVTDQDNGCASTATTTVTQNTTGCTGSSTLTHDSASKYLISQFADSAQGVTGVAYKIYPNPSSGQVFIEFKLPESSLVTMELYSNIGVREKILFNSNVIANQSYKLDLNTGGLSAGTHFCIIRNNGKVYTARLLVLKK